MGFYDNWWIMSCCLRAICWAEFAWDSIGIVDTVICVGLSCV